MKYRIIALLSCLLLFACTVAEAQWKRSRGGTASVYKLKNWHGAISYSVGAGLCSYYGDLKDNRIDLWAKPSIQAGLQYRLNNHLNFRSELVWYRISGADSLNSKDTGIYDRNLSFRADNIEWNVVALYHLFNKYASRNTFKSFINPYVFAGVGLTTNNPKANYEGQWYSLRPLKTEGQSYSAIAPVVPVGAGVAFHLSDNWDIAVEWGYRITFTDYLDDVSTTFVGADNFEDPIARALSDRRPEIGLKPFAAGKKRGNSGVNDWYLIPALKILYTPTRIPKGFRNMECKLPGYNK